MYMSYCRYEGTLNELRACLADAQEHIDGEAEHSVSINEIGQFEQLVRDFVDFLTDNDLLDEDGYLDDDKLGEISKAMRRVSDDS